MEAKPQMANKICFRAPFTFIPCSGRMVWLMFSRPTAVNYLSPQLWFGTSAIDLEDSMVSFFLFPRKKTEKLRGNVLGFELCVSRENEFG